jgi:hypothetical protein
VGLVVLLVLVVGGVGVFLLLRDDGGATTPEGAVRVFLENSGRSPELSEGATGSGRAPDCEALVDVMTREAWAWAWPGDVDDSGPPESRDAAVRACEAEGFELMREGVTVEEVAVVSQEGDAATVELTVDVHQELIEGRGEMPLQTQEWLLEQEDGRWKIRSLDAPHTR